MTAEEQDGRCKLLSKVQKTPACTTQPLHVVFGELLKSRNDLSWIFCRMVGSVYVKQNMPMRNGFFQIRLTERLPLK